MSNCTDYGFTLKGPRQTLINRSLRTGLRS